MDIAGTADRLLRDIGRRALRGRSSPWRLVGSVPLLLLALLLPGWVLQYGCPPSADIGSAQFNGCFNTLQVPFTLVELGVILLSQVWLFFMAIRITGRHLARTRAEETEGPKVPWAPATPVPDQRSHEGSAERTAGSRVCLWYAGLAVVVGVPYLALALLMPDWLVGIPSEGTNTRSKDNDFYHAAVVQATAFFGLLVTSILVLGLTRPWLQLRAWIES